MERTGLFVFLAGQGEEVGTGDLTCSSCIERRGKTLIIIKRERMAEREREAG